ncbi:hypothetical protein GYMLUDRAFT_241840 [Collybiopsis luxurians FD-317 M1]|uniref:Unplaced genomic scaffold GYMLUscaffold_16, whole genome shotgun sequence n=1 Tax=Collybiopsis luxurians FD-317 M1 TaxID=944289 RepID=A0A0D0CUT4_9AGAR|nr:hypothetical protein GYMLUDRAFT_241840 [Collybiopsis luxurians FD-317 M1]
MTRTAIMRPSLALRTSYEDRTPEPNSPASLASSIPTIYSPLTPDDNEPFSFHAKEASDDVFMSYTKPREYFTRLQLNEGRTYLPPLSEVSSDKDSIYSQDSACVVYTSKPRPLPGPNPSITPKSTLTFAAIWDPDHGLSAFSNNKLIGQEGPSKVEDDDRSNWMQEVEENAYLSAFYYSDHPDCEPHLTSRFSTTTTSTSNYIEVDFGAEDERAFSESQGREQGMDLLPGDIHPAWIPQIFTVGYTKPPSSGPDRPEISEPFQLTPMRREELTRHNTFPGRFSPISSYKSSSSLFSGSRSISVSATTADSPKSANSSPTSSLRRGLSFGSGLSREGSHPFQIRSPKSTHAALNSEDELPEQSTSPTILNSVLSSPSSCPSTPTRRPSKVISVLGKLKSPKKGQMDGSWVFVDVEVTSRIHQRVVNESV